MTDFKNIKLIIEYDGTAYHGWQHQPQHISIQQTLKENIETIAKEKINLIGASRTDAGVHALAQAANFKTRSRMNEGEWQRALNSLLPSDIVIKGVEIVPPDFHARFSSKGKIYKYLMLNQPVPSALYRNYAWHMPFPLKLTEMRKAARFLIGRHDFSSFRASSCTAESPVRRIKRLAITKKDGFIQFTIEADAFLHHMVRNIIGTLIAVGIGKLTPDKIETILKAKDRRLAGKTAPPHGLYLVRVKY